jgi:hypothetical protein
LGGHGECVGCSWRVGWGDHGELFGWSMEGRLGGHGELGDHVELVAWSW